jgi:hypothetical protein
MSRLITGLKPKGFTWVIADRLAVAERIGGSGFQHRKVRREEEIAWLVADAHITAVVTMLPGNQNLQAYRDAGLATFQVAIGPEITDEDRDSIFKVLHRALSAPNSRVLVHRETIDDTLGGLLAGYLVWSGRVENPILAVAVVQEILRRPLGPEGRRLVPDEMA